MDGGKKGKVGKLENRKIDEEMCCQSEEKLCKSIIEGLARRSREKHAMVADVEEGQAQNVICFDDITGKELLWHAVRKALDARGNNGRHRVSQQHGVVAEERLKFCRCCGH